MIPQMNKRVVALVALLGLAFSAGTRPAHAQDGANWFDEGSAGPAPQTAPASAPPAPAAAAAAAAPAAADPYASPSAPPAGPQVPYGASPPPGPAAPAQPDNVPETDPRAISEFRSTLDPYGTWVNDDKYGTVWVPNRDVVGADFAPYVSAGRWALTADNDWIWQSDYPFGGVVFHYGRWVWVPNTGWAWVAGRRYANAWVTWRVPTDNYGYIGWAPMAPAWGWYGGVAIGLWWYPPSAYVFCPTHYAFAYNVHRHIVHDHHMVHDVAGHTRNYSGAGVQHAAARPSVLPANSAPPRGPSLQNARIPASAAPMTRVPVRAAAFGERTATAAGARSVPAVPYGMDATRRTFSNGSRPLVPSSYTAARPSATRNYRSSSFVNPSIYARRPANGASLGGNRASSLSERSFTRATQYSAPATRYSPSSFSGPSRSYSAPSRSYSTPSFHSSPSFSGGRSSGPSFHSAPSHSFHGPARR